MVSTLRQYPELFTGRWVTVLTDNATLTSWVNITISSNRVCKWHEDMQEFLLRFEHLPGKDNPVADALSRGVTETRKVFTNEPILEAFEGDHHEKHRAKTNALANPVILQRGQDPQKCTTQDCEALARGNAHGLCQGCWATAYEKKCTELHGAGVPWQEAANKVKETAISEQKRKFKGPIEMRGKNPGGLKETSIDCSSFISFADGACPHRHFRLWDAAHTRKWDKRRGLPRYSKARHFPTHPRHN